MAKVKHSSALSIVLRVFLILLVLFAVLEAGTRWYIGNQVQSSFAAAEEKPEVSFGWQSTVLGLLQRKIPHIEIDTPSTVMIDGQSVSGNPAAVLSMQDVHLSKDKPIAESMELATTLDNNFILATLQQEMQRNSKDLSNAQGLEAFLGNLFQDLTTVSSVSTDAAAGQLVIGFSNDNAQLRLKPQAVNGSLQLTAEEASLFGRALPQGVSDFISNQLKTRTQQSQLGLDSVTVTDNGLDLELSGSNVDLNQLQYAQLGQ